MKTWTSKGFNIFVGFTFGLLFGMLLAVVSRIYNPPVVNENAFSEEVLLTWGMKFTTTESGYIITQINSWSILETIYESGDVATWTTSTGAVELEEDDTIKVLIVDIRGNTWSDIMSWFWIE